MATTDNNSTILSPSVDADWWRGAVIYQIYPRSYQDSNGDGIGDLRGITQRLEHIADLGADAVWISPFFTSPMKDFGYDVSDYKDVDPIFGDLAAFDELIARANELDLKIMIDLVLSHTSDQHPWFKESVENKDNPKSDWYVWADSKQDGTAPNNWLSIFGGPAWTWSTSRRQYFMHNFLSSQPDLNFHNMDVQDALLDVARFWLERGVSGFRLDTINFYVCDKALRDNPALPVEERNSDIAPDVNPYNYQNHLYDKSQPENVLFLERLRSVMDEYPATTAVGEVGDAQKGMDILAEYTQGNGRVHMCYTFDFLSETKLSAERVVDILKQFEVNGGDSWVCWAFSNHDVCRHATRWELTAEQKKLHACLLMSLRGSVCLYQGEELGLPEADIPFDRLQDPYGIAFWPKFKGRDGCRSPMVWEQGKSHSGFSDVEPWLPIPEEHTGFVAELQRGVAGSVFEHYKQFIAFRSEWPVLLKGDIDELQAQNGIFTCVRRHGNQQLFCAFNLSTQQADCQIPTGSSATLIDGHGYSPVLNGNSISLAPNTAAFALLS